MAWTEQRIRTLQSMHGEGYSASLVADRLKLSRNAVIGKSRRLGLCWASTHVKGAYNVYVPKIVAICRPGNTKTIKEIAEEVGCTRAWVSIVVRERGLTPPPRHAPASIIALGRAAQARGLTVADIEALRR